MLKDKGEICVDSMRVLRRNIFFYSKERENVLACTITCEKGQKLCLIDFDMPRHIPFEETLIAMRRDDG